MPSTPPGSGSRRRFRATAATLLVVCSAAVVLLQPALSPPVVRIATSTLLLVASGVFTVVSGAQRVRSGPASERRAWSLLAVAAGVATLGNVWAAAVQADPVDSPSLLSDVSIAVALLLSIVGLMSFPALRRRGAELVVLLLDGAVAGGAFLVMISTLVYSELVRGRVPEGRLSALLSNAFPALDVALGTIAVLLVLRAGSTHRLALGLVGAGFVSYAAADLHYAVLTARGTFDFGHVTDLGWIGGYLLVGLAARAPEPAVTDQEEATVSDALSTTLVFSVVAVAMLVQALFLPDGRVTGPTSVVWVLLITAAGLRQLVLTLDNTSLRRGLERRVAEQTGHLSLVLRQHESLLTSVGDGIYGVDTDGRVTFVNPAGADLLGSTAAELEGRLAHDVFHVAAAGDPGHPGGAGDPVDPVGAVGSDDPPHHPWHGCSLHEAITDAAPGLVSEYYRRADGTVFAVESLATPLQDGPHVRGAVVVFRDVTQRREVERMKNEFLSVVSHELRTPLTSILGSLDLVASGALGEVPPQADRLIHVALDSSERLTRLINDLLDVERISSGAEPMRAVPLDVPDLLAAAVREIAGLSRTYGVRVRVGAAEGTVLADGDQVMQTLLNLIGNAVKFSTPGQHVVVEAQPDGGTVMFRVKDSGRGIPADKLETVFERFGQVDSSDARAKGGTGLGLTISRSIVERHGGTIYATSTVGVGTTVCFTLPSPPAAEAGDDPDRSTGSDRPDGPDGSERPLVLVCDDDRSTVETLTAVLRSNGYRTIGTTDGAEAIGLVASEHPALVLLDLKMPGTSGAAVMAALAATDGPGRTPVVVVSGLGPAADPEVAATAADWLVKPVSEQRLVRTVGTALTGRPRGGSVLLVEDDDELATAVTTLLTDDGLVVARAATTSEAVVLGHELLPDVIVMDLVLPDGDGHEVVAEFRRRGVLARTPLVVYTAEPPGTEPVPTLGPTIVLQKAQARPDVVRARVLELVAAAAALSVPA